MRTGLASIAAAVLVLTGCASATPGGADVGSLATIDGGWQLITATDQAGAFDLGAASVTLTIDAGKAGGIAACNRYGGTLSGTLDRLVIGQLGQTAMACVGAGIMELEARYLAAFGTVTSATLGSGVGLILMGDGVTLGFTPVAEVPTAELIGPTWRLQSMIVGLGDDGAVSSVNGDGFILFGETGELTGSTGCRGFTGTYLTESGQVMVLSLAMGDATCPADLVKQENHVLSVLDTFRVTIDGDQLTLIQVNGNLGLVYRA